LDEEETMVQVHWEMKKKHEILAVHRNYVQVPQDPCFKRMIPAYKVAQKFSPHRIISNSY